MKKKLFHVGMEVAVCQEDHLCAVTKVLEVKDCGIRTEYKRRTYYGDTWTVTGLEPFDRGEGKSNRAHIRAVTDADRLELDRRDLVQYLKAVNWDKIELPLLIGVRSLLSDGEGVKLRSVPG